MESLQGKEEKMKSYMSPIGTKNKEINQSLVLMFMTAREEVWQTYLGCFFAFCWSYKNGTYTQFKQADQPSVQAFLLSLMPIFIIEYDRHLRNARG